MATYVIGDIHGCYAQLEELLTLINFNPRHDILWFTGDLVNGGPHPAEVIRFIKGLGDRQICVLGNHDLVLLAYAAGQVTWQNDRAIGLEPFFTAPDKDELLEWLRMRPMVHYAKNFNTLLVHAGVLAQWNVTEIINYAHEVEKILHGPQYLELYANMFGNQPDTWSTTLTSWSRLRFLINCFVRMRFCTADGRLELHTKGNMQDAPPGFLPWFKIPRQDDVKIIFGHWAALHGKTGVANVIAMDTGCVWGYSLSALCLENGELFSVANASTL